jgi:DNA-binding NarL/FixJ family response regulator
MTRKWSARPCARCSRPREFTVVGAAADGAAAVSLCRQQRPDVVLMDVRMPVVDGIEATRRIAADGASRILILTTFDLDEHVYDALDAGASGFLLKDVPAAGCSTRSGSSPTGRRCSRLPLPADSSASLRDCARGRSPQSGTS